MGNTHRSDPIALTAEWIAAAMAGAIVAGDRGRAFTGVSIDTRTMKPGDLFVAIRGERFDGADFAQAALVAGAGGVVVPRGRGALELSSPNRAPADVPAVLEVDDTTVALQMLARAVRIESGAKVVAITGSAGKTTTKEIAAEFLAARYSVVRNRGNLNNHIGLPLSLIDLRERPEIAVVELGMNHAGEISALVHIAEPDVRVWTNVGEAHLGFFESVDAIADAKAEVLEGASPHAVLIANADDDQIVKRMGRFAGRVMTFGIDRSADVRATDVVDRGVEGTSARVTTAQGAAEVTTPLVGRGNLANVLAATAVALEFGVPLDEIVVRAGRLVPAAHRGEIVRLANGATVIDDSYNANPTATRTALNLLVAAKGSRRIAVLGEMLELGEHTNALHEELGRAAAQAKLDVLLTVGGAAAAALASSAIAAGLARDRVRHFATSPEAAAAAVALVGPGDVVLVKGSRGVRTDQVVERLKAELA
jgi:UDP-N-acetylmuramoyl-tripeptide--D-alanyl-D-alanine ligase